jgi:hypothetical protein
MSGGGWVTPFATLVDPRPQVVLQARSPDPADTTFTIDLGAQRANVGLFHFQRLNITTLATMRLRADLDGTFASPTYDTGTVSGWPQDKAPFTISPWGVLTLNGQYEPEEYVALGLPRYFIPTTPVAARFIKVEIFDPTADVPAQIGCFGACETWAPLSGPNLTAVGPDKGFSRTLVDESDVQTVPYGSRYFIPRGKRWRFNLGFSEVHVVDLMNRILGWVAYVGKSTPIAISINPDDKPNLEKNSLWGTLTNDVAIDHPFYATARLPLTLEQLI